MKKYVSPELEVIKFSTEDVIVTSLTDNGIADGGSNDDKTSWEDWL